MQQAPLMATNHAQPQQNTKPTFTASDWRTFEKNALKGFLDLKSSDGMIYRQVALHKADDGRRWIGLPAKPWTKADGTKTYLPMVEFTDKAARNRFQKAALAAIDKLISEVSGGDA